MKKYHRNIKNNRSKVPVILGIIFVALLLSAFLFKSFPPSFLTKYALFVARPFIVLKNNVSGFFENNMAAFNEKKDILKDNEALRDKLLEMEIRQKIIEPVLEQNQEFKEILGRSGGRSLLLSSIISRPRLGGYDAFVIDAGSQHDVRTGMVATAYNSVFLGHVFDVSLDVSRVRLVSYPGVETSVFIEDRVSAIAVGRGGENMELILPHDIEVNIGDSITTLDSDPLLLGFVEDIIKEPTDPFQKILFRLPVNIYELRYVYLINK
jgi:cell shape-determining protein MreC